MTPLENLVGAHLDTWNSPSGPQRARAIATVYSTDVFVGEPGGALRGHRGVEQAIAGLQAQLPGAAITRTGPIQMSQDLVTYIWSLGRPNGPTLASGRDVLLIRDDLISHLYVVIDAP
ncbi:MAG: hypothetical protein ACK4UY_06310 [Dietzia sp.]